MSNCRKAAIIWIMCACMYAVTAAASAPVISLHEEKWDWNPGGTAVFSGTVEYQPDSAGEDLTMQLSVTGSPVLTDMGKIVFVSVNGSALTIRKQNSAHVFHFAESGVFEFTGNWFLPANGRFSEAAVKLAVFDPEGRCLQESELIIRSDADTGGPGNILILPDISRYTAWIAAAAAAVWITAVLIILIRRKHHTRS